VGHLSVYRDVRTLAIAQRKRLRATQATMEKGHTMIAIEGREDLHELTAGKISSKTLRKLGHPYGRGSSPGAGKLQRASGRAKTKAATGRASVPLLPINKQSGKLRRGIFLRRSSGGKQAYALGSGARHAKYIMNPAGTSKMVGRGVMTLNNPKMGMLERRWHARNRELIEHVAETALR
jgi:hypothetical protein